jgi:hypothetical protein
VELGEQRPLAPHQAALRGLLEVPDERDVRVEERGGERDRPPVQQRVDDVRTRVAPCAGVDVLDAGKRKRADRHEPERIRDPQSQQPVTALGERLDALRVVGQLAGDQDRQAVR